MEEGSPGDVFNVRCKREGAVQSDAEALGLQFSVQQRAAHI